jgi:hypothetical protein
MGLWILCTAKPGIPKKYPDFGREYYRVMGPVFRAQQNGGLHALYARYNPRLAVQTQWQAE